ncbi:hypothetical protein RDI58_028829 [Solanum bulbocastanum]|uniref:Uncharacterized protein n=1 Tax=Solanum bulbocastanum TaxID=147425 RepID=A0AAN8XZD6_SOLBU
MTAPLLQLLLSVGGQRLIASTYPLDAARRIRPWHTLLETLTGCTITPTDMDGAGRVRIHSITGYLRDQLQVDPIGDATQVEQEIAGYSHREVLLVGASERNESKPKTDQGSLPAKPIGEGLKRSVLRLTIQLSEMSVFWHLSLLRMRRKLLTDIDCIQHGKLLHKENEREVRKNFCKTHEVHAPDRVIHQFGRRQQVPAIPSWGTNHHVHDQRRRLGPEVLEIPHCHHSRDATFIMPVDDMPQTPERKKVVKRIEKNVNIKDLPAKKRKRDNDEDGYTGVRPRDVLLISRMGCGT